MGIGIVPLRRHRVFAALLIGALVVCMPDGGRAAEPTVYDARYDIDDYCLSGDDRCFEEVKLEYAVWIGENRWEDIFTDLREDFADSPHWTGTEEAHIRFLIEMGSLIGECASLPDANTWDSGSEYYSAFVDAVKLARFRHEQDPMTGSEVVYFRGRANEIVPSHFDPTTGEHVKTLNEDQALDLMLRANTIDLLGQMVWGEVVKENLNAVRNSERRWINYLDRGFSQYPWEMWVNGWATSYSVESPPGHQFIIVHPEAAIELGPMRTAGAGISEAMTVAVLGWVDYYGPAGASFWGVSAATAFRDDMGIGVGGLMYFGSTASIGLMWHDRDRDGAIDSRPFLTVSLDLFRLAGVRGGGYLEKAGLIKIKRETLEAKRDETGGWP